MSNPRLWIETCGRSGTKNNPSVPTKGECPALDQTQLRKEREILSALDEYAAYDLLYGQVASKNKPAPAR